MLGVQQYIILIGGILMLLFSMYSFFQKKEKTAIFLLLFGAFLVRLVIISIDPFLHLWDEHYHALVAKNMMIDPLKPMLYTKPILNGDTLAWSASHIWVHKQPLFLWQMAASMHLFGVNEWAIRLPSAILGALECYAVFRIGKLLINDKVGYYAAFLWAVPFYHFKLLSGAEGLEQNDLVFAAYMTFSVWAFAEYWVSQNKKWLLAIGLFSGAAILTKWLTGLLVYAAWGLALLFDKQKRTKLSYYFDGIKAVLLTVMIFLPWQIYISYRFPVESAYSYAYNRKHIFEVLEGHGGRFTYYLEQFPNYFGIVLTIVAVLGLYFMSVYAENKGLLRAVLGVIIINIAFFSIVQTKMPAFGYNIAAFIYVGMGAALFAFQQYLQTKIPQKAMYIFVPILLVLATLNFNFGKLELARVRYAKEYFQNMTHNIEQYKKIDGLLEGKYVIFNLPNWNHIDVMFYSKHIAYPNNYMTEHSIAQIKKAGYSVAVFKRFDDSYIPPSYTLEGGVTIIDLDLKKIK